MEAFVKKYQNELDALYISLKKMEQKNWFINCYHAKFDEVVKWRYASDEYFSPFPFEREMNKFKRGRLVNQGSFSEALKNRFYTFGFNEKEQLIFSSHLYGETLSLGLEVKTYNYFEDAITYDFFVFYPEGNAKNRSISTGKMFKTSNNEVSNLRVGKDGFLIISYIYSSSSKVECINAFSKNWNGITRYDLVYDKKDKLNKIMVGDKVWWKSK